MQGLAGLQVALFLRADWSSAQTVSCRSGEVSTVSWCMQRGNGAVHESVSQGRNAATTSEVGTCDCAGIRSPAAEAKFTFCRTVELRWTRRLQRSERGQGVVVGFSRSCIP